VYARLPVWAQHRAVSAYGVYWHWLRFGPGYQSYVQDFKQRERFSAEQWTAWQSERVRTLLGLAATQVDFYKRTWTADQKAAAQAGRLQELPLLEKVDVRNQPEAFLRQDMRPRSRQVFHTSGTTGTPVASIWTVSELRDSMALREVRSAGWAGVSFKLARATFSGRMVEPNPSSPGPFHRYNSAEKQVYFSAFHLGPQTAPSYVKALHDHKVTWLTGYAFSYYLLARLILEQNLKVSNLKAVITTSEKLTPEMRTVMEEAYGCRVYEEYSMVENSMFASECEHGRLHVSPDVGVVEILRPDGSACDPDEMGEVVSTGLMRQYQPFVRYRVGDLARWDPEPCVCSRSMPILKDVTGRIEDVVIGEGGRQMVRFHGIFVDQPHVIEGQIIQEELSRIRVKVVPGAAFSEADVRDIVARVRARVGPSMEVVVEPVDRIARTSGGKFKAVVSLLNAEKEPDSVSTVLTEAAAK
jgi:phenylacetate-CoA ligase